MIARMKHIMRYLLVALIALPFASCEHKDLCYHHPHTIKLKVIYDWQYAPDADPEGMYIFFYPIEGGEPYQYRVTDKGVESGRSQLKGGEIEVPPGVYNVMTYNLDCDATQFRGLNDFSSHEAYTRDGNIFEPVFGYGSSEPNDGVAITPDMVWGNSIMQITVPEHGTSYIHEVIDSTMDGPLLKIEAEEEVVIATFYPREMVCTYTYEIRNVVNINHMQPDFVVTLSGMSASMNMSTEELGTECFAIPFTGMKYNDERVIRGGFYTFGHHEDNAEPHKVVVYAWLKDGRMYKLGVDEEEFDVTDQIHNAPDKRRVHFIIDGMTIPVPIQNGDGFYPEVDDWGDGGTTTLPV